MMRQKKESQEKENHKGKYNKRDFTKIGTYFLQEKWVLLLVGISGILYNIGMVAGPWFEGQLAQCLCDIIEGKRQSLAMLKLAGSYVLVIFFVQAMRYLKRLYVRKFANDISRSMKKTLYNNLIHKSRCEMENENAGTLMTKAIADVDACVEGMRKFTTEVFDTGVVMIAYAVMLLMYDVRLACIVMLFPPIAYMIAEKMKAVVTKSSIRRKESAERLNGATFDRVENVVTYRVYGQEVHQNEMLEDHLLDYEKKVIWSNIWENSLQPLYQIVAMISVIFILWFGWKNVVGTGWCVWNIAAFSTFLSCFLKLAVKSSKAAKLFNAVQKASVSWKRIQPFLKNPQEEKKKKLVEPEMLQVKNVGFSYENDNTIFEQVSFAMEPGNIIGITGAVASGKTTFGKMFLCEQPYEGHIYYGDKELWNMIAEEHQKVVGYLGHNPELLSASIKENITLGEDGDIKKVLEMVCMDKEIDEFPDKIDTKIGNGGVRLSGGQQARIALARALYSDCPILVLDDPFSAVDQNTEHQILHNIRKYKKNTLILIISHRLLVFEELDGVLWLERGRECFASHKQMSEKIPAYAKMYELQYQGSNDRREQNENEKTCYKNK